MSTLLGIFKGNARLERNLPKAKEQQEAGDFQGPDGKYVAVFTRIAAGKKKDEETGIETGWAVIETRVADVEGQEDYANQKLPILYFKFADSDYETAEEVQARYFQTLSQLGIDTTVDDDEFDDEVKKAYGGLVNVAVKTKKGKYKNLHINGLAADGLEEKTYEDGSEAEETEEAPEAEETAEESPIAEEPAAEEEGDDDVKASEWVGFEVGYKKTPRAKARQFTIKDANDEADTVTLQSQDGEEIADVAFDKLILPED